MVTEIVDHLKETHDDEDYGSEESDSDVASPDDDDDLGDLDDFLGSLGISRS
jgi:hypothetical protein